MIREYIEQNLNAKTPTEYIYKITVMRNEIQDMIAEFNKTYEYCFGCQDYVKVDGAREVVEDGRVVVRCGKCNSILKFKDSEK